MLYFVLTGFLKNLIIYLLEMYIRTGLHFTKEVHNMLHILSLDDGLDIFKALGSDPCGNRKITSGKQEYEYERTGE